MKSKRVPVLAVFVLMTSFGGLAETKALANDAGIAQVSVPDVHDVPGS